MVSNFLSEEWECKPFLIYSDREEGGERRGSKNQIEEIRSEKSAIL